MFRRYTTLLFPLLMAIFGLALIVSLSPAAEMATITVNSTADVLADDGQCTLREAITAANTDSASGGMTGECPAGSGNDTIILSAESYTLMIEGADEDSNATGDLDLTSDITIEVADGTATLDGNQLDRVLHVHDEATVLMSNVTITGGKTPDGADGEEGQSGGDADHGGGIYNAGVLSLTNSTLYSNTTGHGGLGGLGVEDEPRGGHGGHGGGIYNVGSLTLTSITFTSNHPGSGGDDMFTGSGGDGGSGGAFYNAESGDVIITDSSMMNNRTGKGGSNRYFEPTSAKGGEGGNGGGIFNAGLLTLNNSIISNNETHEGGVASLISGSSGAGEGGGIANRGITTIVSSTISHNMTSHYSSGSWGGFGGGISNSGTLILTNTLVSQNRTGDGGSVGWEGCPMPGGFGGGIHNTSVVTLTASSVINNRTGNGRNGNGIYSGSIGGFGGGFYNEGTMTLIDSTINNNITGNGGDGFWRLAHLPSTILSNKPRIESKHGSEECAYLDGCGGDGGGIYHAGGGTVTLINSTVSNNITGNGGNVLDHYDTWQGGRGGDGGGIYHAGEDTLILLTSTVSGNRTGNGGNGNGSEEGGRGGNGGGIFNKSTLSISHSTIAENSTGTGGQGGEDGYEGVNGDGGGIANHDEGNSTLKNTILADNSSSGIGPDCIGILSSEGYNLIQETTDCQLTGDMTGNLTDIPATLAPLADYRGATFTHALLADSPALDAGSCSDSSTDQRHRPRPIDAPSLPNADDGCDMGAYEAQVVDFHFTKSASENAPYAGYLISYTITVNNLSVISTTTHALISDTLPTGVTFAGAVTLSPPQASAILAQEASDLPTLASNLIITASTSLTLTVPVTVNIELSPGTSLTNIASVSSSEVPTATTGAVTIRVPAPDLSLEQTLYNSTAFVELLPGEPITINLAFSNIGNALATGIVLSDIVPSILTSVAITQTGAPITDTGASPLYVWEVADLAPGAGGMITITGVISPELSNDLIISNDATITGTDDIDRTNNQEQINLSVELPRVYFSNSTYKVAENGTTGHIFIKLNRSNPYREVTVDYMTEDGTASAGEDYIAISETVTIFNSRQITITIPDDKLTEGDETVNLTLSNPRGAVLGSPESAILTIIDNEATPTPTATLTPTAGAPTNTPMPSTPTVTPTPTVTLTPTVTPTITAEGAMEQLYLPLLLKE